jgi:hypothetical protein
MKLVPWLTALHLVALSAAASVALTADCDGPRLRAFWLAFIITGWTTSVSAFGFLVRSLMVPSRERSYVLLIILLIIGLCESRMAVSGWKMWRALH